MTVIFLEHSPQSQKRSILGIPWEATCSCALDPTATWKIMPSCKYRNVAEQDGFAHFDTITASNDTCPRLGDNRLGQFQLAQVLPQLYDSIREDEVI